MNRTITLCFALYLYISAPVWAAFPEIESFDDDQDVNFNGGTNWQPDDDPNYNPVLDPNLDGAPPQLYEWRDIRADGSPGIIEEVANGFAGVSAPRGGANFGVVYFEGIEGPMGRPSYQQAPLGVDWSFQMDLYTDPAYGPTFGVGGGGHLNGSNGIPDFWWTNAVQDAFATPPFTYLTESGFTGEILDDGSGPVWRLTTLEGLQPFFDAEVGAWYSLEVLFKDNGIDGQVAAVHNIYNEDRTQLLYTHTLDHTFLNQPSSSLGGPLYTWFVYPDNLPRLLVDNIGVDAPIEVPEPASLVLFSVGMLGLAAGRLTKRRRAPKGSPDLPCQ